MPDLILGLDHPYTLVATVTRGGSTRRPLAMLDLHLPRTDLRLRFHDRDSLDHFLEAVVELSYHIADASPFQTVRSVLIPRAFAPYVPPDDDDVPF